MAFGEAFKTFVNHAEEIFMLLGLLIALPPIFIYRFIRFLGE